MTYKENIERLRARGRYNLAQREANTRARINFIEAQEKEAIDNINKGSELLVGKRFGSANITSGEGGLIPFKFGEYLDKQEDIGFEAEKKDRARKVAELAKKLQNASDIDTAHLNVKYDMLMNGYLYEDADRFAQLSPHAQTAYARRKLGLWKESVADKLNYKLAKDNTEYTLKEMPGKTFTPEGIHNDPLISPIIKEAFVDRVLDDLIKENGIDGFSKELLELEGINDWVDPQTNEIVFGAHSEAKNKVMGKYRKNYNESSSRQQLELLLDNFKSDKDLLKLLSGVKGLNNSLAGKNGSGPLGPGDAWVVVEDHLASILANGDMDEDELKKIFYDQPSPTVPGQRMLESHRRRFENIIQKAGNEINQRANARKHLDDNKGQAYVDNVIDLRMQPGGDLYKFLYEEKEIDKLPFDQRAKVVRSVLSSLEMDWVRNHGGELQLGQSAPWVDDLFTDLVYIDQDELLSRAITMLETGESIRPRDWEQLSPKSKAVLSNHPKFGTNQGLIEEYALRYETVTPNGKPGWKFVIPDLVKTALKNHELNDQDGALVQDITARMTAVYKAAKQKAFDLDKSGEMTGDRAHDIAMGEVKYQLGLEERDDKLRKTKEVEKVLSYKPSEVQVVDDYNTRRGEKLAIILGNKFTGMDMLTQAYWIPSLGPNSQEFKELLKYAETGEGGIPKIYNWIAGNMPNHTVSQIASWQLAQVGKTLPKTDLTGEALLLNEIVTGFNRRIGYKANSSDIQQAKIIAVDGVNFTIGPPAIDIDKDPGAKALWNSLLIKNPDLKEQGYSLAKGSKPGTYTLVHEDETTELHGTPVTFETTSLSFDEKGLPVYAPVEENPMYMGNNLEAWLAKYGPGADGPPDAGDATRTISPEEERENVIIGEENRLNQIYIDKGFHDEDPGPPPKLEDFPIQPGDEKFVVPLDPRITAEFYNYNVYAFQEATKEWEQKKNTYRPLTKEITRGSRKKYKSTMYFNPETDKYEHKNIEARLFPGEKISGRAALSKSRGERQLQLRLTRANALPDEKVVNIHRTNDGRYIQGPITVYKHVDEKGYVEYKINPKGSESYLQSFWNIPGSPVLSPALQDYALELYNTNSQTV